jgi:hypothetical protein
LVILRTWPVAPDDRQAALIGALTRAGVALGWLVWMPLGLHKL